MNAPADNSPQPDERRFAREPDGDDDQPPEPCHVGIVVALSQEAGGLIDRLSGGIDIAGAEFKIREGGLSGRRVAVVVSRPGRKAAARAAEALIAGHAPRWVISAGFAGGLVDNVARGDIVVADEIVAGGDVPSNEDSANEGRPISVDVPNELAATGAEKSIKAKLHVGRFVTVDALATTPDRKRALATAHDAIAVDMESLAVAEVCRREQRAFLAIRIVSDAVDDALPAEVSNLIKQKSLAGQFGAVAGALFKRPSSIKDLYRLKEDALLASDSLAKFLEAVVAKLTT